MTETKVKTPQFPTVYVMVTVGSRKKAWLIDPTRVLDLWVRLPEPPGQLFNWGRADEGSISLAMALVTHALGEKRAIQCFHSFKWRVLVNEHRSCWALTTPEIVATVERIEAERKVKR